jgi:hypothetical protein
MTIQQTKYIRYLLINFWRTRMLNFSISMGFRHLLLHTRSLVDFPLPDFPEDLTSKQASQLINAFNSGQIKNKYDEKFKRINLVYDHRR